MSPCSGDCSPSGEIGPPAASSSCRSGIRSSWRSRWGRWLASPGLSFDEARRQAAYYRERCAVYRRTPSAVAIRRDVYVGESPGEAKAVLEAALARGYRGFAGEALVAGSVDEVVERLRALGAMGYTDVIVRHLTDEPSEVLGSLARLRRVRAAVR